MADVKTDIVVASTSELSSHKGGGDEKPKPSKQTKASHSEDKLMTQFEQVTKYIYIGTN